jgi:pyridoxamine 5'-phosphate oxidase
MAKNEENLESLEEVLNGIWQMLQRGVSRFKDPFHWPVLGTTGQDGSSLRTVILRQFILPERVLVCHTDARAGKVQQISRISRVCWLFYHPRKKIQLRISGAATLHTDDRLADEQWAATKITSRLNYCATKPPGTPVDRPSSGLPDFLIAKVPTLLDSEKGRQNFMVIAGRIESLDWLQLRISGNRRARFQWTSTGLKASWLIP